MPLATLFILCFLVALSFLGAALGQPYTLLNNARPKCFSLTAPRDTTLTIKYGFPDLAPPEDIPGEGEYISQDLLGREVEDDMEAARRKSIPPMDADEGLDYRYNDHMKAKIDAMKMGGHQMREASIVISQKGDPTIMSSQAIKRRMMKEKLSTRSMGDLRIREEIFNTTGRVEFSTGENDGPIEVCVQSMAASVRFPRRVSLDVTLRKTNPELSPQQKKLQDQAKDMHQAYLSRFDWDLSAMIARMDSVLANADYSKEQDAGFHEQSTKMQRAGRYWPMIHIAVLVVTGILQATYMVSYFKRRHLI